VRNISEDKETDMLEISIPSFELWDEESNEFRQFKGGILVLEHSLVSISKWEMKWCKPFLAKEAKTNEETLDYIKCMNLSKHTDPILYTSIPSSEIDKINEYIKAPMTATYFSDQNKPRGGAREEVTSELIYYWMIALEIPFECQKWHLNRLLTLIRVCEIKNQPPKKRSRRDIMSRNTALNEARRKKLNTKG